MGIFSEFSELKTSREKTALPRIKPLSLSYKSILQITIHVLMIFSKDSESCPREASLDGAAPFGLINH